jgi:hypothetical protein
MTILERLLPSQDVAALVGDIVEESKQRSTLWYWVQILAVLVVGTFREVRAHWLLTLRATAVGSIALAAYVSLWVGVFYELQQFVYAFPNTFSFNLVGDAVQRSIIAGVWLAFLAGFSLCGWTVGRSHRRHGIALVPPFAGLAGLALIRLLTPWAASPRLIFMVKLIHIVTIPAAIIIGGYWSTRRVRTA